MYDFIEAKEFLANLSSRLSDEGKATLRSQGVTDLQAFGAKLGAALPKIISSKVNPARSAPCTPASTPHARSKRSTVCAVSRPL
tara:strand:- start:409 stop:660 length:252 start_codon:yes stop_codon:yes gene_type:complete